MAFVAGSAEVVRAAAEHSSELVGRERSLLSACGGCAPGDSECFSFAAAAAV